MYRKANTQSSEGRVVRTSVVICTGFYERKESEWIMSYELTDDRSMRKGMRCYSASRADDTRIYMETDIRISGVHVTTVN